MTFPNLSRWAELPEEARIALEAARRGGEVLSRFWQQLVAEQIHEKSRGDLVTAADLASEQAVADFLSREMPEAAILSEEGTSREGSGTVWYVDPLDGTTNFVQRFPIFAVSIGLAETADRQAPNLLAGVVYNPVSNELFYGVKGGGSFIGDERLHVAEKALLKDAVIATGFPRRYHAELDSYLREFRGLFPRCRAIRRAGAAALDLCWTAQGIFDGFWEHRLSPWDIAAGALIVQEAGGICTDFDGASAFLETGNILGASPAIHREIMRVIHEARTDTQPI